MTDTPSATAVSIAATDRPWPSSSRLGTYGSTSTPKRRRAITRMASPSRPSASKSPNTMTRSRRSRARASRSSSRVRIRQEMWVVETGDRLGEPGRRGRPARGRRVEPGARSCARRAHARRAAVRRSGSMGTSLREAPAEPRFEHRLRMPCGAHPRLDRPLRRPRGAQDGGPAGRGARAADARPRRRSSQACQSTRSGLATKIDEYVPMTMPISSARTKSLIAEPPKRNSDSSVRTAPSGWS